MTFLSKAKNIADKMTGEIEEFAKTKITRKEIERAKTKQLKYIKY